MQQLSVTSLSSISGGFYSSRRPQLSSSLAVIAAVFKNSPDLATYDTEGGYIVPVSSLRSCHSAPPKNGDYNAQGQQYSWGTWWDDTH